VFTNGQEGTKKLCRPTRATPAQPSTHLPVYFLNDSLVNVVIVADFYSRRKSLFAQDLRGKSIVHWYQNEVIVTLHSTEKSFAPETE